MAVSLYTENGRQKIAAMIREARGKRGYRAFEDEIGISHGTIRNLELCQEINISTPTITKIAKYLGYSFEQLQAILLGRDVLKKRDLTADELMDVVRDLPVSEVVKFAPKFMSYLASLIPPAKIENGNGKH